jgi:sterol desaturase/sphingolipid hydroxylase (fatty acid hydroxylase superfamily)
MPRRCSITATSSCPRVADALLRPVLVTPDMHRVHHSTDNAEANSNFGFNLAIWDRLFGTYRPPRACRRKACRSASPG